LAAHSISARAGRAATPSPTALRKAHPAAQRHPPTLPEGREVPAGDNPIWAEASAASQMPPASRRPEVPEERHRPQARPEAQAGLVSSTGPMPRQWRRHSQQQGDLKRFRRRVIVRKRDWRRERRIGGGERRRGRQCSREQRGHIQRVRRCEFDSDRLRRHGREQFCRLWGWTRRVRRLGQRNQPRHLEWLRLGQFRGDSERWRGRIVLGGHARRGRQRERR
jgi:hypothetical protein